MGSCGCGDLVVHDVLKVDEDKYIVFEKYPGCNYCDQLIGVSLHFFNKKGIDEFMIDNQQTEVKFDEFGGSVKGYPLFKISDILENEDLPDIWEYANLNDYIDENGLGMIQFAMKRI